MSNILKTIEYLKQSPQSRFLTLVNLENNAKIGKASIYLDDIPNEDLQHYIKTSMGPISKPTLVWVELRVKNGSSSMKKDAYKVMIDPPVQEFNNVPAVITHNASHNVPQVHEAEPDFFKTGGLGATLGLGFPQIMDMQRKADRLNDKEEQLAELKEDLKEIKHEKRELEIENRELKTQLSTSQAKQEMAVMMVKAENKSFYDSPAFEKIMDKAPEVLASIVAMKTGGVAAGGGALGGAQSETQSSFFEYVSENLTDEQVNYLGAICHNMNNEMFKNELHHLISKYANL